MNQEKELLEKVKEQYAQEKGYENMEYVELDIFNGIIEMSEFYNEVSQRYANELLKLRLVETREEIENLKDDHYVEFYNMGISDSISLIDKILKEL